LHCTLDLSHHHHHHHHLFAQNATKVDSGYVNEQDRKAHCALTSAHNITSTVERGALKMQDRKMQDLKMQDQIAGHENAGPENAGPNRRA